jgi:hypothetical protein
MDYIFCVFLGAIPCIIYAWYCEYQLEKKEKEHKKQYNENNKDWQDFYNRIVERGYGKWNYDFVGKNNMTHCNVERSFQLLDENQVIKNILEKRKENKQ